MLIIKFHEYIIWINCYIWSYIWNMSKFYIKICIGWVLITNFLIAKNDSLEIFIFLNYLWVNVLRVFMFLYRLYWGWKKWGWIVTLANISIYQFFLGQLLEYQRFHFPTLDLRIWNSPFIYVIVLPIYYFRHLRFIKEITLSIWSVISY